jgi:uncharacterized membrane protein
MARQTNKEHKESLSLNERVAIGVSSFVGSMWCAYIFGVIALISLPETLATGNLMVIVSWFAQTFLQLVLLSVIMVGQNLQSRHSEMRAEADYESDLRSEAEIKQVDSKIDEILHYIKDLHASTKV